MTKPKTILLPAFLECRPAEGEGRTIWHGFSEVAKSPDLQKRCVAVDKRRFRSAINRLRKAGRLYEVPYVGPR